MATQLFGTIETVSGKAHAMLCIDTDQRMEFMFHVWGNEVRPTAVLMNSELRDNVHHLRPAVIFRVTPAGHVYDPMESELDAAERNFREKVTATLKATGEGFEGQWTDPEGTSRPILLDVSVDFPSSLEPYKCESWSAFKSWADNSRTKQGCKAFRGHGSNQFPLKTTLSRVGRTRLDRYCKTELRSFAVLAEASLSIPFDLDDKSDYATVIALAQHHGLPTPMLDWTASPYVAAFFAFSDAIEMAQSRPDVTHVRIYALTREFIDMNSPPVITVSALRPYISAINVAPRHNPRLLAQQGMFLATNMSNVESFIQFFESENKRKYLYAADVPITDAAEALEDLAFMGLTAATMFPGLDGVGRMIRHKMLFRSAKARSLQNS